MKIPRTKRPIDAIARENYSWWRKTYISIKKTEVKTWKMIFIVAFIAGAVSAIIWSVAIHIDNASNAEGMASLSLNPASANFKKGDVFKVDVMLDTRGNDVVVAKADVKYDQNVLELQGWDTDSSVFAKNNACMSKGTKCKVVDNNPAAGQISIMLAKPRPGVNTHSGLVATLRFRALQVAAPGTDNISLSYSAGDSKDSAVVADDGHGTGILSSVKNARVSVTTPSCETFTYYDWSACVNGKQTRAIVLSTPPGCEGGNPVLEQDCSSASQ